MHTLFLPRANGRSADKPINIEPAKPRVESVPRDRWPLWAQAIAKFRRAPDTGLGDTVVHLIGDTRSESFKKWFARKFDRSCGCIERQSWLNQRFPYLSSPIAALLQRS
jgi:hypothetical protein